MKLKLKGVPIYVLTSPKPQDLPAELELIESVVAYGVGMLQLRKPTLSCRELVELGIALRALCNRYNIPLIVNDRLDVCLAIQADGVHLGQQDMPIKLARQILGKHRIIGFSTHQLSQARSAYEAGADYISLGPIFLSPTKPDLAPIGPSVLTAAKWIIKVPIVAIGGITSENIAQVFASGADIAAVISAIWDAPQPQEATRGLIEQVKAIK